MPLLTEQCDECRRIIISGSYGCRNCYEDIQRSGRDFEFGGQDRNGTYCTLACLEKHKRRDHMKTLSPNYSPEWVDEIRDRLRALGYLATVVNIDCIQIYQNRTNHLLSQREAECLLTSSEPHPLKLKDFAERRGANNWYDFPQEGDWEI